MGHLVLLYNKILYKILYEFLIKFCNELYFEAVNLAFLEGTSLFPLQDAKTAVAFPRRATGVQISSKIDLLCAILKRDCIHLLVLLYLRQ